MGIVTSVSGILSGKVSDVTSWMISAPPYDVWRLHPKRSPPPVNLEKSATIAAVDVSPVPALHGVGSLNSVNQKDTLDMLLEHSYTGN